MNALVPLLEQFAVISARASALIACVLLLRWLLRGHVPAQCFHLLWVLVGHSAAGAFCAIEFRQRLQCAAHDHVAPLPSSGSWKVRKEAPVSQGAAVAARSAMRSAAPASDQRQSVGFAAVLTLVWIGGIALQCVLLGVSGWRMRRMIAEATCSGGSRLLEIIEQCAATLRLRRVVRVLESPAVAGPAVVGLWRPRLLLPPGLSTRLSDEQLRFVLLHECAHLRRP
jgi:beta-lactamase regulating signal transducer with metallopeptidase domain